MPRRATRETTAMNLAELNRLIKDCESQGDAELVEFYKRKRAELIAILNRDIVKHIKNSRKR